MSGSSGGAPTPPSYTALIQAAGDQFNNYNNYLTSALNFANKNYNANLPIFQGIAGTDVSGQQGASNLAGSQGALYQQLYEPLQQKFVSGVEGYDTPGSEEQAAGQASADVANQYQAAGDAAKRQLESFGVDPSSTRFAGLDIGTRTGAAAAKAGAANQARINRQTTGLGLEATAANVGQGTGTLANQSTATGVGAGGGAGAALTGSFAPYSGALMNPQGWGGLANSALGLQGQFTGQQFNNALQSYNANQNSSSGFGSLLGGGLGFLGNVFQGAGAGFFAKGGAVPASPTASDFPSSAARGSMPTPSRPMSLPRNLHRLSAVPLTMRFDDGGGVPMAGQQVPPSMSPSGGAMTDDIPAVVGQSPGGPASGVPAARINAGEFIIPKDVAGWMGQKGLQNMVMKARKEMSQPQVAHPTAGAQGVPMQAQRPVMTRAQIAAHGHLQPQMHHYANGGAVKIGPSPQLPLSKGFAGGAGRGPAINLGGHQPPRPTPYGGGAAAGAIRSAIPGGV